MSVRACLVYVMACALAWGAGKKPITIDTLLVSGGRGEGGGPTVWAPDGKHFAYLKGKQILLYDVASKSEKELLSLEPIEKAATPIPESTRFDWQNRRVRESSFEWSESGKELLLSVGGDLFLFQVAESKWIQLTATPEPEHDPKLSP